MRQKAVITQSIFIRIGRNFVHAFLHTLEQYWRPCANRSGHLGTRYVLSNLKSVKNGQFCVLFLRISRLTMEFGKIDLLCFSIAHQLGTARKLQEFCMGQFRNHIF